MDDSFTLQIGKQIKKFQLVRLMSAHCFTLAQVWDVLWTGYGAVPQLKWHEAFKAQWTDDGQGDVIAAVDPSREARPYGSDNQPYVLKDGRAYHSNGGLILDSNIRWLVMVE